MRGTLSVAVKKINRKIKAETDFCRCICAAGPLDWPPLESSEKKRLILSYRPAGGGQLDH
jgi:hypothetical protein